jgi:hypothetical protein
LRWKNPTWVVADGGEEISLAKTPRRQEESEIMELRIRQLQNSAFFPGDLGERYSCSSVSLRSDLCNNVPRALGVAGNISRQDRPDRQGRIGEI